MSIIGKWRIAHMDVWDQEAVDLVGPGFIEISGRGGHLHFIAIDGWLDCRHGQRGGRPYAAFTWDGNDECDPASGRGWVKLLKDGSLSGHIFIHHGDDSSFKAVAFKDTDEPRPAKKRGLR